MSIDKKNLQIQYTSTISTNPALGAKLLSEYSLAAQETEDIRVALYMAAFYQGFFGHELALRTPFDLAARTQWQLKAIELGSWATLTQDDLLFDVTKELRSRILYFRDASFQSPEFDLRRFFRQLRSFVVVNKEEANELLEYLQDAEHEQNLSNENDLDSDMTVSLPEGLFDQLTVRRHVDLEIANTDAFDLLTRDMHPIIRAVYDDDLGQMLILLSPTGLKENVKVQLMEVAVFAGSLKIVQYLVAGAHVDVNLSLSKSSFHSTTPAGTVAQDNGFETMTWIDQASLYGKLEIAEFLLAAGTLITLHNGTSALHLVKDDHYLADILCGHLQNRGMLAEALEWKMGVGCFEGYTPLLVAVMTGSWAIAAVFLRHGANPNALIDNFNPLLTSLVPCLTCSTAHVCERPHQGRSMFEYWTHRV